jgi:hypothetical protein
MKELEWNNLRFGCFSLATVKGAVADAEWQEFREKLHGIPLSFRYDMLKQWVDRHQGGTNENNARIQVTNYVNALKRAGMLK